MNIKHSITLNLSADGIPPRLHMVQGDANTRTIVATLWDGAQPYTIPAASTVMIRFRKPDGTGGLYDTTESGAQVTASGNIVTAPVATQMLSVAGVVQAQVDIYGTATGKAAEKLATFRFAVEVAPSVYPDAEIISSDYFNIIAADIRKAIEAAPRAEAAQKKSEAAQQGAEVARDDAVNAKTAAESTKTAAVAAQTKAEAAQTKAAASAASAAASATSAEKSASTANHAAETAGGILSATQTAAQNASESAKAAEKSAQDASQKYTLAKGAANDAAIFAQRAASSATAAKASEDTAAASATAAAESIKHAPRISASGKWELWDATQGAYVATEYTAIGKGGTRGLGWYQYSVKSTNPQVFAWTGWPAAPKWGEGDWLYNPDNGNVGLCTKRTNRADGSGNAEITYKGTLKGADYVLTDADKSEIAALVLAEIPDGDEVAYG